MTAREQGGPPNDREVTAAVGAERRSGEASAQKY